MAQSYPITTRVLTPYYDSLPGSKKGCFFYIAEHDCVCLLDTPYRKDDIEGCYPAVHQSEIAAAKNNNTQLAWGFPAYLVAVMKMSGISCGDGMSESYWSEYVATRTNDDDLSIRKCVGDWYRTLTALTPYIGDISSVFFSLFVYRIAENIKERITSMFPANLTLDAIFYDCDSRIRLIGESKTHIASLVPPDSKHPRMQLMFPQLVLTPSAHPMIVMEVAQKNVWAAYGLVAVLIGNALKASFRNFWHAINFADLSALKLLSEALETNEDIEYLSPVINLQTLRFDFPFSYTDFFEEYLDTVEPVVRDCAAQDPTFPMELSEGDNIYSYILYAERTSYQVFMANQLHASFTRQQQNAIDTYFRRYLQYLEKHYGASLDFMNRVNMQEYGHIEPIQISLTTHMKVTDKDGNDVSLEHARMSGWDIPKPEQQTPVYAWPYYTTKATDEDRHTFEDFLRSLCKSNKKSLTRDIKDYLKSKVDAGIITRPSQQNTEFEILQQFGYPYGNKAYYAA